MNYETMKEGGLLFTWVLIISITLLAIASKFAIISFLCVPLIEIHNSVFRGENKQ